MGRIMNPPVLRARLSILRGTLVVLLCGFFFWPGGSALAEDPDRPFPTRTGFSVAMGQIYDPNTDRALFAQMTGFVTMDHDRAAFFSTPDHLRFKLEATVGTGEDSPWNTLVSLNMLSLCYIDYLATETLRPYVEGGIGLLYTRRRWEGQGLRFLHNPVAGAGVHISPRGSEYSYQASLRFSHASNGGLHRNNKAMNAVLASAGILF